MIHYSPTTQGSHVARQSSASGYAVEGAEILTHHRAMSLAIQRKNCVYNRAMIWHTGSSRNFLPLSAY
jgi:uncharacterized 2Fe-2S/4Fe-4S cluster protein (DUF4445 family)